MGKAKTISCRFLPGFSGGDREKGLAFEGAMTGLDAAIQFRDVGVPRQIDLHLTRGNIAHWPQSPVPPKRRNGGASARVCYADLP